MAFTPSRDPAALQGAADAFVSLLSQLSGVPVRAQVASDYAGVIEALRSRRVDLAFVHPVGYVLARQEAGCDILVRDVWQDRTAYKASFYVRRDKGIARLEDLRGRTIAFVDPASSSGYIYPMVLLIKQGESVGTLASSRFVGCEPEGFPLNSRGVPRVSTSKPPVQAGEVQPRSRLSNHVAT